jgi:translation initiation factor IF-2
MTTPQTPTAPQIIIPAVISVQDFSELANVSAIEVIKRLITFGVMASMTQTIDYETAAKVAVDLGLSPVPFEERISPIAAADVTEELLEDMDDHSVTRPPVVAVLGHVDHGKTSLLDAIRKADVVSGEAGGITQHIGAYEIEHGDSSMTFIDTPGHAAFTAMRARGAQVTDIAILVVAADDGVMPQTIEAINHIRAANVPMIVAINKMDLPAANPDRVKQQLTEHEVVVEDFGGDVVAIPVSATTGEGLEDLLEAIELVAEISELRADPARSGVGIVVEAELDTSRGPVATILVKTGTLRQGDAVVVGQTYGKIKAMFDHRGERIKEAPPSTPARIMGLQDVPSAGDRLTVAKSEREARQQVDQEQRAREAGTATGGHVSLDSLFTEVSAGNVKELIVVLKTDVKGSAEAIRSSLEGIGTGEVGVRVILSGTGPVTDSDVQLAEASGGLVLAFNVKTDVAAARRADAAGVEIRSYNIIYGLIEAVEQAMTGMYDPIYETRTDGHAEVRQVFRSSRVGQIAGSFVTDGTLTRNSKVRVLRGGEEIADVECNGLKRFKDDVREVQNGFECGITLANFDRFEENDVLEFYHLERVN